MGKRSPLHEVTGEHNMKKKWDDKWNDCISSALTLVQNMRGKIRRQTNVNTCDEKIRVP